MSDDRAIRTAGRIFTIAAIYGVIILLPIYSAEPMMAKAGRPVSHPELLYGFVGAALAFQLIYWSIGRDPLRYRPLMPIAVIAKLSFGVPTAILFVLGRVDAVTVTLSWIDLLIGACFLFAWRITRAV
ncbi:MAG: hypothetical protein JWN66_2338 [Sphingomonas bacterium]|uniref:hypothetical protein n=1 Tax=Sphingomonas bacterium TaxID=1895847 RepID=UPI00262D9D75|nr:hypothetical protein [Sphingomonas bacterium]MDB5705222.1 hypothetical protein [Sphingomonas bacterium]